MVYISFEDFLDKSRSCRRLSREEEKELGALLRTADASARARLIEGYIPFVVGHIKRCPHDLQTLGLVYTCMQALERAVDSFDFLQDSETFAHRLSWWLRQATTRYIADRGSAGSLT